MKNIINKFGYQDYDEFDNLCHSENTRTTRHWDSVHEWGNGRSYREKKYLYRKTKLSVANILHYVNEKHPKDDAAYLKCIQHTFKNTEAILDIRYYLGEDYAKNNEFIDRFDRRKRRSNRKIYSINCLWSLTKDNLKTIESIIKTSIIKDHKKYGREFHIELILNWAYLCSIKSFVFKYSEWRESYWYAASLEINKILRNCKTDFKSKKELQIFKEENSEQYNHNKLWLENFNRKHKNQKYLDFLNMPKIGPQIILKIKQYENSKAKKQRLREEKKAIELENLAILLRHGFDEESFKTPQINNL